MAHRGHVVAHFSYFGLVAWEAHGFYGAAAAVCLAFMLIEGVMVGAEA